MKEKISRFVSAVTVICFLAFLCIAAAVTVVREKETYSFYENRNLAVMPAMSEEGVLDGSYFTAVERYLCEHSAGRNTVLKAMTYIDMNILHRPVVNDVVVCDGILLPFLDYKAIDKEQIARDADTVANALKSHASLTESYGGKFYYVAVPCQYVCYEEEYPWYLNNGEDYTKESSAALFSRLDTLGISYIDMYSYYTENSRPEHFSSTVDNHFSIMGAYDTYREIMDRIAADTGLALDILEEGEFDVTELPNRYLGSRQRKLFGMWESEEKLSIITPKENIPFERWNYGSKTLANVYTLPENEWADVLYTMYMSGDVADTIIKTNREELPSILIYGDSFTNAVECIAWYSFDTMYSLDFRHYNDMTLDEFINEYKPDIVVCIRDYESIISPLGNGK